jgi:phytanoyl-CoA hydroxylase
MAARRRRGLDSESADRAIINVTAMRVVVGHCPRDQVPDFTDYLYSDTLTLLGFSLLQEDLVMFRSLRTFHSKYGGLWIDADDWQHSLQERLRSNKLDQPMADKIASFVRDGFIILPQAAEIATIDQFERDISDALRNGNENLLYQTPGDPTPRKVEAGMPRERIRINDAFVGLPSALKLLGSPAIVEFLAAIFDEPPMVFQSLSFDTGSGQGLHQDTAYVVVDRPLELAACWIALEDVRPGSGELEYLVGSHRLSDWDFGGNKKHWNLETDGEETHTKWCHWIIEEGARRGLRREKFLPRKGDVLIWHADLAHGGSLNIDQTLTRKSLVGHFCPVSAKPNHFSYMPERAKIKEAGALHYTSAHFDL